MLPAVCVLSGCAVLPALRVSWSGQARRCFLATVCHLNESKPFRKKRGACSELSVDARGSIHDDVCLNAS